MTEGNTPTTKTHFLMHQQKSTQKSKSRDTALTVSVVWWSNELGA